MQHHTEAVCSTTIDHDMLGFLEEPGNAYILTEG